MGNRTFGRKEKPRIIFYGHLDTVPAGNLAEWSSPPFEAKLVDGKIIGRGAQDCKMGVASAVVAARVLSEAGVDLSGTITVATAADEESGGHKGIHELINSGSSKRRGLWCLHRIHSRRSAHCPQRNGVVKSNNAGRKRALFQEK